MSAKPVALIFGGSGQTGGSIVSSLLEQGDFVVKIATRLNSGNDSLLLNFQRRGAEIVVLDLIQATDEQLEAELRDVHTVICALAFNRNNLQQRLVKAALKAGVKRFVPSDWGTPGRRGLRELHDEKLDIRDFVRKSGIGYTFIDVGFWFQRQLPLVKEEQAFVPFLWEGSRTVYGDGNTKAAYIDLSDIGRYVARIIADERTLNQYVFVWGGEFNQNELIKLAEEFSGIQVKTIHRTAAELDTLIETLRKTNRPAAFYYEYHRSMWVLGEDSKEQAVLPECGGAILGADLYPDFIPRSIREYAAEFYSL